MSNLRRVIADQQALDGRLFFYYQAFLAALRWFDYVELRHNGARWDSSKRLFDLLQSFSAIKVTYNDERRIARVIPLVIVSLHIGRGGSFEVFKPSDGGPVIRMLAKRRRPNFVLEHLPWTVESDAQLFLNHLLLGSEFFFGESGVSYAAR